MMNHIIGTLKDLQQQEVAVEAMCEIDESLGGEIGEIERAAERHKREQQLNALEFCDQCAAATIQGVPCHETGCPNAWKTPRQCTCCGETFTPPTPHSRWCLECSMDDVKDFERDE